MRQLLPSLWDQGWRLGSRRWRNYDRPQTFFYLDPPYFRCEDYYGKGLFRREDFALLRDILAGIKGRFLMSLNDTPEVLEIFKDYIIDEVATRYSCGKANQVPVTEVLIRLGCAF